MYVNTAKLLEVLETQMPGTTLHDKSRAICKEIGLRNANVIDYYKFESGRVIQLGVRAGEALFQYLTTVAEKGVKFKIRDVVATVNIYGGDTLRKNEAYAAVYGKKKSESLPAGGEDKSSSKILSEVLTELKDMNKTLQHIAVTQDETCHFIRTLVYALNGEPKK